MDSFLDLINGLGDAATGVLNAKANLDRARNGNQPPAPAPGDPGRVVTVTAGTGIGQIVPGLANKTLALVGGVIVLLVGAALLLRPRKG